VHVNEEEELPPIYTTWRVTWLTQKLGVDTREIYSSVWGGFWAWSVKILVCPSPTGYMFKTLLSNVHLFVIIEQHAHSYLI
jgi:hypothetical protein